MQLTPAVLTEEISGPTILLVVLQRYQNIEDGQDLGAHRVNLGAGDDEDEIVSPNVTDESPGAQQPLYDVVQNSR